MKNDMDAAKRAQIARLVYVSECAHLGIMAWPEQPTEPSIYHRLADSVLEYLDAAVAEAVKERDAEYQVYVRRHAEQAEEIARLKTRTWDDAEKLAEARREERERLEEELREARFMLDAFKGQHTAEWWEGFRAQVMASYPPASTPEPQGTIVTPPRVGPGDDAVRGGR